MRSLALLVLLLASRLSVNSANDRAGELIRREVPWGQPVNLADFGAARIEITIRSRQITFISADIADYTRMVPVVVNDYSIYGPSRVAMQPTRESRRIEKRNGIAFPGSRSSMYPVYREPQSGIQVFFLDEAAGQNRDALVIGIPPAPSKELPPGGAPSPEPSKTAATTAHTTGENDGYLSDELLDWYLKLQSTRRTLDLNDQKAVARFNEEAARYHAAVKKERAQYPSDNAQVAADSRGKNASKQRSAMPANLRKGRERLRRVQRVASRERSSATISNFAGNNPGHLQSRFIATH